MVSQRIAHAYLFCGSRGTGKTSTAKILSKAINCLNPENGDPCGECENCLRMEREESLDVIEIDAASNNGVDEMRELRDAVKYPPQYGKYKVYIIDEVHMLSTSAFNALLKTLEEPPAHIVFILATTEPQKLPETILSRCQRFDFGRISVSDIMGRLKEAVEGSGAHATDGALMQIARAADGGMRDALSILDMCLGYGEEVDETLVRSILGTTDRSFLFEYCDAIAECDAGKVFQMTDRLMRDGKDAAVFGRDVSRHMRSLLIAKSSPEDLVKILDITEEEAHEYRQQCEKMTFTRMIRILDLYMSLETEMRYVSAPRIALENTGIKCCLKTAETDPQALLDRISEMETKIQTLEKMIADGTGYVSNHSEAAPGRKETGAGAAKKTAATTAARKQSVPGDAQNVWKELMQRIQKTDMAAWSFLSQGTLAGCQDRHYKWQANRKEEEKPFVAALNKPERNQAVCKCLSEITGEECLFTAVEKDSDVSSDDGSDDAYLNQIIETFGREPVSIVDRIP